MPSAVLDTAFPGGKSGLSLPERHKMDGTEQKKKRKRQDEAEAEPESRHKHKKSKPHDLQVIGTGEAPNTAEEPSLKSEKKHKKHKGHRSTEERRSLAEDRPEDHALEAAVPEPPSQLRKEKKHKKRRDVEHAVDAEESQPDSVTRQLLEEARREKKESKKKKLQSQEDPVDDANILGAVGQDVINLNDFAPSSGGNGDRSLRTDEKRHKKHKKEKKVADSGYEDEVAKSLALPNAGEERTVSDGHGHKKHKRREKAIVESGSLADPFASTRDEDESRIKKDKKREGRDSKKKSRKDRNIEVDGDLEAADRRAKAAMAKAEQAAPAYPFFTQVISIHVPLYPVGFENPHMSAADQHLKPLLKRYSSLLHGVLLDYRNPRVSEHGPANSKRSGNQNGDEPALLLSVDGYAVGFGRLTASVDLFVPSRGAPMAGTLNLQNEGHIGVVCWNLFNASIEARRLPRGWKWVDLARTTEEAAARAKAKALRKAKQQPVDGSDDESEEQESEADEDGGTEAAANAGSLIPQMHTAGYWVNEHGHRVVGRLEFRIKNYDTGVGGDFGFLSIEGTMLNEDSERALAAQERAEELERHKKRSGLLRPETRRVPEFSMTRFAASREDQEEIGRKAPVLSRSRPMSPDD